MKTPSVFVLLSIAVSVAAMACGDSRTQPPPTSPSASALAGASGGNATGGASTTGTAVTGTINGLSGICPALTFTLEGKSIKTSAATNFGDGTCAGLRNGLRVGVVGAAQADGSLLATQVRVVPPPMP